MRISFTHCQVSVIQSENDQPPACCRATVHTADQRVRELEELLCEAEQELEAAGSIIAEQDKQLEALKRQLEEMQFISDLSEIQCRKLEQDAKRLANKQPPTARPAPADAPRERMPAPAPSAEGKNPFYPPGYKPNPLVEAMVAGFRASRK